MSSRHAVVGGLLSGALAAAILIILLIALGRPPTPAGSPTPLLPSGLGSPTTAPPTTAPTVPPPVGGTVGLAALRGTRVWGSGRT